MSCACFTGTAYTDSDGNCRCNNNGVITDGCEGVLIDGICTGGIKTPMVNAPTAGGGQLDPLSTKRKITNANYPTPAACAGLVAPNGYHYIQNAAGQCVLAVNYDSNTERFTSAIERLLGGGSTNTGNSVIDGITNSLGGSRGLLILGAGAAAIWYFTKGKGTTRVRSVMTKAY